MLQLTRVGDGPVLTPNPESHWEKDAVCNAAVTRYAGHVHLLYRAVAHSPGDPNRSYIGHAWSEDGLHFARHPVPALSPGETPEESQGVEDPRVVAIDGAFYMQYTAYNLVSAQIAMARSTDLERWERLGIVISDRLFGWNKDASLFPARVRGRYCMMHRPDPDIFVAFSDDLRAWGDHARVMGPEFPWESKKIGGGAPPILTEQGWLMVYHGVDDALVYRLGIALLDRDDPTKVLRRQSEPILEPQTEWERVGDVPNVVFTCGALLEGDRLAVYYGAADKVIGLAVGDVRDFLG